MGAIRVAKGEDLETIYTLISLLEDTTLDHSIFEDMYRRNLSNPSIHYFVYEQNRQVVGFISVYIQELLHHAAKIGEIQEFIVHTDQRGQGIGTKLFEKAKEACIENGIVQLEVCCNQKRHASHAFYTLQGMTNHHYKFCLTL